MFIGRFYHSLEEKGRISLPKSFRDSVSDWVVTRGLDGSLFLFAAATFETELAALADKPFTTKAHRDWIRLMSNDATAVTCDSVGRVQLPEYLIQLGHLSKEVVVVGSFNRVELWDRATYHTYLDRVEPQAEQIAESLHEHTNTHTSHA